MAKQKGSRKYGRNKASCKVYSAARRAEVNQVKRVRREVKRCIQKARKYARKDRYWNMAMMRHALRLAERFGLSHELKILNTEFAIVRG